MALNLTHGATASLVRLDPTTWLPRLRDYVATASAKKQAKAAARAADKALQPIKAALLSALDGATAATCGNAVLTVKNSAAAEATLTLTDGSKLLFADVSGFTVGNRYIAAENVTAIFGGRAGSISIDVAGDLWQPL